MAPKNTYKPVIVIAGLITMMMIVVALFVPYWMKWSGNGSRVIYGQNGLTSFSRAGIGDGSVNSGLWRTEYETKLRGTSAHSCSTNILGFKNCFCNQFGDDDSSLRTAASSVSNAISNAINDVDDGGSDVPKCYNTEVDGCDVSLTNGQLTYDVEYETSCDTTELARYLRCGTVLDSTTLAANFAINQNLYTGQCQLGKWDDCMRDWIRVSRAGWIIGLILTILTIILYMMLPNQLPTKLPTFALIGVVLTLLNAIAITVGFIAAVIAYRAGCDHDWKRLPGDVTWHASFVCGVVALVFAWLWFCWAIFDWTRAKKIKREWQAWNGYVPYGNKTAYMGPQSYGPSYGPATYADDAYYSNPYPYDYGYASAPADAEEMPQPPVE